MGICFAQHNNPQLRNINCPYVIAPNNLTLLQENILKLIYNDLKSRITEQALNLENFLLFFHKNGFWGVRLFQEFSFDTSNLITQEEFVDGIAKLMKTNQDKKIELLFKFFSSSSCSNQIQVGKISPKRINSIIKKNLESIGSPQNLNQKGVKFQQFLVMLYNYPKQDLKQILNDQQFFQKQIRNSLVTISQNRRLDSVYNLGLPLKNNQNKIGEVFRLEDKSQTMESTIEREPDFKPPSMVGKDILKQIKQRETDETTLKLKDGDHLIEVKTNNIHHLVKKFAINMFKTLGLNYRTGKLSIGQFTTWIKQHKTLYNNYYNGFHNDIWQLDPDTHKLKFMSLPSQKQSTVNYVSQAGYLNSHDSLHNHQHSHNSLLHSQIPPGIPNQITTTRAFILLRHSTLILFQDSLNDHPFAVICLDGLQVNKIFESQSGYGFIITHRDGIYPSRKLFFKNEAIRDDWNQSLKYYRGGGLQNVYQMGRKIGTGKFSVVYQAVNKQTKNNVAIKVIEYKQLDIDARKLIAHQSSIMQIFCHPLLVQFKECIQTKTHLYIITELCPGKDLFELVRDCKYLFQTDAAFIIQQIIVGIRYMHSLGIIHRDLKPENIMVSACLTDKMKKIETVKIIDFGFANYLSTFSDMSPDEVLAGTPNYIAPQLLRGQPISYKADNFAIGSILYFMLSGALPFNSHTLTQIFAKTLDGNYNFQSKVWDKVSIKAKDLIDKFLKSDPQQRITLQDALKHPWFKQIKQKKQNKSQQKSKKSQQNQSTRQTKEGKQNDD